MPIALPCVAQHARAAIDRAILPSRSASIAHLRPTLTRSLSLGAWISVVLASLAGHAQAQTWSAVRTSPLLWQITALDRTGEAGWPYGAEDVAGDGLAVFSPDEAGADVRSVYADADAERLWLRAYVAATSAPTTTLAAFFFIDTDGRTDTGGPANGDVPEMSLGGDPTHGGYERALGVAGDGRPLGAWSFNAEQRAWLPLAPNSMELRAEAGLTRDPLSIGAVEHGYVQVDVVHALSGLDVSCGGTIFVRTRNLAAAPRAFGDDDAAALCRLPSDAFGDPVVLRDFTCHVDTECPSGGHCDEGVCLFAYPCSTATDCPTGTRCSVDHCVRVVDQMCTNAADCNGLLCESAACVACAELGPRACSSGLACSPNGACVDPGSYEPGAGSGGPGKVRGGAFSCSLASHARATFAVWSLSLALCMLVRRRVRRRPPVPGRQHGEGGTSR